MSTLNPIGVDATTGEQKVYEAGDTINGAGGGGAFTDLTDVPASYVGAAGKVVAVNGAASALEFITVSGSGLTHGEVMSRVSLGF